MLLEEFSLAIGDRVAGEGGTIRSTIGAAAYSPANSRLLGVTTREIVGEKDNDPVYAVGSGQLIGQAIQIPSPYLTEPRPAWALLGLVSLAVPVRSLSSLAGKRERFAAVEDPYEVLGMSAFRTAGGSIEGQVTLIDAVVQLRHAQSYSVDSYGGLIEVSYPASSKFASSSSGGAPVWSKDGRLIGLIIGGVEGRAYIAPMDEFLAQNNLLLADEAARQRHNEAIALENHKETLTPRRLLEHTVREGRLPAFSEFVRSIPDLSNSFLPTRLKA